MLRRLALPLIFVLFILVAAAGMFRLKFDTNILSMLPGDLPEVRGLESYHQAFAKNDELVILIQSKDDETDSLEDAAQSLGERLLADGNARRARWQPMWMQSPEGLSELIAYLWLNGDPESTQALAEKLSPENSRKTLDGAIARIATAMEGEGLAMRAHDPFGFLDHPAITALTSNSSQSGAAFESADGHSHLLFIDSPKPIAGYRDADAWLAKVRQSIAAWQKTDGQGIEVGLTGEPAFSSEIGHSMERDLSGSIGITLGLIALLFWWMQRRLILLAGLIGVQVLVFAVALGVAGWIYGSLGIMAFSSFGILIGLSVDYGLIICQEAKLSGSNANSLRDASAKPVMWCAATTIVVFLALNLAGLPGMGQLGTIVATGLFAAAAIMISGYLPFVVRFGVNRRQPRGTGKWIPKRMLSYGLAGGFAIAALGVLAIHGLPGTQFDSSVMRPSNSQAMTALDRVTAAFPRWSDESMGVIIEAKSGPEMLERVAEANRRFSSAEKSGLIRAAHFPIGWWPDEASQTKNRAILAELATHRDRLMHEAGEAGFTEEGTALGNSVLSEMATLTAHNGLVFPQQESAIEITRVAMARKADGSGALLGNIDLAPTAKPAGADFPKFRALTGSGIWLSDWRLFNPAISDLVGKDVMRVLIPMFLLLVGMMIFIFRRPGDILAALVAMSLSGLLMLAVMSFAGLTWNFVNLMATPLLLGTGIDYAIHVILTIRRTGCSFKELWNGTSKALMFCGVSTVIGFGSLCFSSIEALRSLGFVSVTGISITMIVAIFLLPGWCQASPDEN
ncbi:MMPL family transporter [Luteolibacter pohnpeiensis]|uniref:MMPL family transporter n=1 Tax=Luteolibacter pohnpeiensis TaxID=454153 RepID=A0A934VVH4_9BACT|nr:MMPL family transporter [Luteolibacter pohnpeiensis]MBK1883567.1 MMPL family transporter [Luteolibacter pohnpeiensis]